MDYDDLVSRLRSGCDANSAFLLCYESADVIEALRARIGELARTLNDHLLSESAETMRADKAEADLAAARALLGEARGIVHAYLRGWPNSDAGELMDRIDAALAGEKK